MRTRCILAFFLVVAVFSGCENTTNGDQSFLTPSFDLTDAVAIAKSAEEGGSASSVRASSSSTQDLFRVDSSGNILTASENVSINSFALYGDKVLVGATLLTEDENPVGTAVYFLVNSDGSYEQIDTGAMPVGANDLGNLVFPNASIYDMTTGEMTELNTTLTGPGVQSMSGNFAIITDHSIFQIIDTVTSKRYNIRGCNGPRLVALNASIAFVEDCSNDVLIDMTTGTRSLVTDFTGWNHESIYTGNGAVVLSGNILNSGMGYGLAHFTPDGTGTLMINGGLDPGSFSCSNCGGPNTVLFGTGDWFVVRELNRITAVDWPGLNQKAILSGYNVTSIDVVDTTVYFLAEDSLGQPVVGTYDLETDQTTMLDSTTELDSIRGIRS